MPLVTMIERDGERLQLAWGWWHVQVMMDVAMREDKQESFSDTRLATKGRFTLAGEYHYRDPDDGEVLDLLPGDELAMWRE